MSPRKGHQSRSQRRPPPEKPPPPRNSTCPECQGAKGHYKEQNSGPATWIDCGFCQGKGEV